MKQTFKIEHDRFAAILPEVVGYIISERLDVTSVIVTEITEPVPEKCAWKFVGDELELVWNTACGFRHEGFCLECDKEFKFCPYCAKQIEAVNE